MEKGIFRRIESNTELLLGLLGFVCILIITANVVARFVLKVSMAWSDELLRTLFIYGYFIGVAMIFCNGGIMRLELLDKALEDKPLPQKIMRVALSLVNMIFFGIMAYYIVGIVASYMQAGTSTSTSATPAWVLPFGFAVGMVIMAVYSIYSFIRLFFPRAAD